MIVLTHSVGYVVVANYVSWINLHVRDSFGVAVLEGKKNFLDQESNLHFRRGFLLSDDILKEIHGPNIPSLHYTGSDVEVIVIVHAKLFKMLDVRVVYIKDRRHHFKIGCSFVLIVPGLLDNP